MQAFGRARVTLGQSFKRESARDRAPHGDRSVGRDLVQTIDNGSHDNLPVAGAILDARAPETLPRQYDADVRPRRIDDRSNDPQPGVDERGRVHGAPDSQAGHRSPTGSNNERALSQNSASPDIAESRRRRWPRRVKDARLRRQDKSNAPVWSICCCRSVSYTVPPESAWCRFSGKAS
jgi:hypothetical protein